MQNQPDHIGLELDRNGQVSVQPVNRCSAGPQSKVDVVISSQATEFLQVVFSTW